VPADLGRSSIYYYAYPGRFETGLMETKQIIKEFIIETFLFGADDAKIEDGESLLESGIVDSTGVLELVAFLESEFGLDVKDNELIPENLDSIDNLAGFIGRKS
jgi:acyl carrier protein